MVAKTRKYARLNNLQSQIDHYLSTTGSVRTKEKTKFGEVFTPVSIIDTMLAMLPASVWTNPNLRWLDPAVGIGQFPLKIIVGGKGYPGLYVGLEKKIPSPTRRISHIFQTMLTCVDINPEHTKQVQKYMKTTFNITPILVKTGDCLDMEFTKQFDIIVGNPPYNSSGTKRSGEKRLHIRFTEFALEMLKPTGYLLFVCPPSYREAGSTMNMLFQNTSGSFVKIVMLDPNLTHKLFHIQSRVDMFLYGMEPVKNPTEIIDEKGDTSFVTLDLTHHISNYGHSIFEKIRKRGSATIVGSRSAEASTATCKTSGLSKNGKYSMVHLIIEEGRKIIQRIRPHKFQTVPKLLMNGLGVPYVFYDKKGEYGATQVPIVIPNPSKELVEFTKTKLFYYIIGGLKITGNNNLPYMLNEIPDGFGVDIHFTNVEQERIEETRIPTYEDKEISIVCP